MPAYVNRKLHLLVVIIAVRTIRLSDVWLSLQDSSSFAVIQLVHFFDVHFAEANSLAKFACG